MPIEIGENDKTIRIDSIQLIAESEMNECFSDCIKEVAGPNMMQVSQADE